MTSFVKISLCFLVVQLLCLDIARCTPIGEITFKKTFDIGVKPLPFKPLAFIKEEWSPFGNCGMKHGLVKRDLDTILGVETTPLPSEIKTRLPATAYEVEPLGVIPITVPLYKEIAPIPAPPFSPVVLVTPPPAPEIKAGEPINNDLFTDIRRVDMINAFLKSAERNIPPNTPALPEEKVLPPIANSIIPEQPKIDPPPVVKEEPPSPFIRGSRFALYIGNMLVDILRQFLNRTETVLEQPMPN